MVNLTMGMVEVTCDGATAPHWGKRSRWVALIKLFAGKNIDI